MPSYEGLQINPVVMDAGSHFLVFDFLDSRNTNHDLFTS